MAPTSTLSFTGTFSLPIPSGTAIGTTFFAQVFLVTPQNEIRTTNAIEIVVGQ